MDQHQLLLRTINLASAGFRRAVVQPTVGWLIATNDKIWAEGWLDPSQSYQTQLTEKLSNAQFPINARLCINTNPFSNSSTLSQLATQYQLKDVNIANEANADLQALNWFVNRRSYLYQQKKRPYIILKWAQTVDGFVARPNYDSKWISGVHARKLVHQWRSQEAAIWVGNNTYRYDNPRLNVRDWVGENPRRIVVDPNLSLDRKLNVFDQSQPTLYYSQQFTPSLPNLEFALLPNEKKWIDRISYMLSNLHQRQIVSLFVEGGSQLLNFLIENGWWDEARVFTSGKAFGEGIAAPMLDKKYLALQQSVSEDQLATYYRFNLEAEQEVEKEY
jgi:diaminohydroxyphosphoribosylaminopyrimidine deaminase/5-amino-6-(5-phosphoribosylamino)uracil reductase